MKPNILYIHSHDTGRYIQPYGHAIATPRLQRLAEEGVLFRQNFCINPTCSPSRAALLTGCYPHENGMLGLAHRGFALYDYKQHLVHALRGAGYTSALSGVQHIALGPEAYATIGYDRVLTPHPFMIDDPAAKAVAYLDQAPAQPFFLSVGFGETHRIFPKEHPLDDARYCLPPAPLPDTPETREDMARYKASARRLDEKVGAVLDALERNGLAENTLVVCTTDHGIAFPRMKCNLHDSGTGTMLIVRGPGGFAGGKVVDTMTSHLDIFPTICELLGIAPPPWLRGTSLLPLVQGRVASLHDALFFEVNFHAAYEPMRAVRTRDWKYIRRYDGRRTAVLPNCDDGESKSVWLEGGWRERPVAEESLFDLRFDPNETENLAGDPARQAVLQEMRRRMREWMEATRDPLLRGELPVPATAIVNDADGLSPNEKPVAFRS
jgi:N-sulfoglucosamine sulfohydrolase